MQSKSQKTAAKSAVKRNAAARATVRATKVVGRRTANAKPQQSPATPKVASLNQVADAAKKTQVSIYDIRKMKQQVKRERAARYTRRDIVHWCLIVALAYSTVWILYFVVGA